MELRGFEPRIETAEMSSELRVLAFYVVMRVVRVLGICLDVLRDVTVPRVYPNPAGDDGPPRHEDLYRLHESKS